MEKIIGLVVVLAIGLGISWVVNSQIDASADKHVQEVLDVCTNDPTSSECSSVKKKYNATVTCSETYCDASIPVTHWYIIPIHVK